MSYKRQHPSYDDNPSSSATSYISYGTSLPPFDASTRDDGSYVPLWKQEVTDERGRKRLHGAFTGGFSAGYFNTVGSKEGWTPSTFKSSRNSRAKATQARPEDFMDDEDVREAEEAQRLETSQSFGGLGSDGPANSGTLMDLLVPSMQDTMGFKLLRKMGWRDGQGLGPRKMRQARSFAEEEGAAEGMGEKVYLFAPDNAQIISFVRKDDARGLGYGGEPGIAGTSPVEGSLSDVGFIPSTKLRTKLKNPGSAFGVGVLNDDDEEDPYEIRPKTAFTRTVAEKKSSKKSISSTSTRLSKGKHLFVPKKIAVEKPSQQKCHDNRPPLPGFRLGVALAINSIPTEYIPPPPPDDWALPDSCRSDNQPPVTTSLDPRARGELLGEKPLPGKSVFSYMNASARDRIASMTGKTNLPPALGEVPILAKPSMFEYSVADLVPKLEYHIAAAALNNKFIPYAEDPDKRARYRTFLEIMSGQKSGLPDRKYGMNTQDWVKEMNEFVGASRIFKPLIGSIANRFTTSATSTIERSTGFNPKDGLESLLHRPAPPSADPAEEAAKMSMYGLMTRSIIDFCPTPLLCKRFGVRSPVSAARASTKVPTTPGPAPTESEPSTQSVVHVAPPKSSDLPRIDADKNDALENERAADEVFRAIFGEDGDEDDDS